MKRMDFISGDTLETNFKNRNNNFGCYPIVIIFAQQDQKLKIKKLPWITVDNYTVI